MSQQSSAFFDHEPSGLTNKMTLVIVDGNIVNECQYNAIQVSASEAQARGEAVISNNTIIMGTSYNPTIASKNAINVRTNKAVISNNTMNGGYDRLMDIAETELSISNNVGSIDAGERYEYIKLANNSVAAVGQNIFTTYANLVNNEINADSSSIYTAINTSSANIEIGNSYEQNVNINGNSGLKSRAKLNIGDLRVDSTGAVGNEYARFNSNSGKDILIESIGVNTSGLISSNANIPLHIGGNTQHLELGGMYEQEIDILGDNNSLDERAFLNIGDLRIDTTGATGNEYVSLNARKSGNVAIMFDDNGHIRLINVPTSSSGLPSGSIWNNAGVLNIV